MKIIKIEDFASKVCRELKKKLEDGYEVEVVKMRKNNGVVMHGLMIHTQERNASPTIYLETFWEDYCSGTSLAETVRRIRAVYQKDVPAEKVDMDFFQSFEKVRDKICYRLVNREKNKELLEDLPHMEFLDLALCFYYAYQGDVLGEGTILIHNSHMRMWGTTTEELFRLAQENTPRLFPWGCSSMQEIIREVAGCTEEKESEDEEAEMDIFGEVPMTILSNEKRFQGAVCMLYPGVLEGLAEKEQRDLYILPCSVHEVILLPDTGAGSEKELRKIIAGVNRTQIAPEEVLSDTLYRYSRAEKEIRIA